MRITVTILKKQFTLELKLRNLLLKLPGLQVSAYFAAMHSDGWALLRRQKSAYYRRGFVARLLWLGFIVRQGAVRASRTGPRYGVMCFFEEDTF